jgi:hypothetical protein
MAVAVDRRWDLEGLTGMLCMVPAWIHWDLAAAEIVLAVARHQQAGWRCQLASIRLLMAYIVYFAARSGLLRLDDVAAVVGASCTQPPSSDPQNRLMWSMLCFLQACTAG